MKFINLIGIGVSFFTSHSFAAASEFAQANLVGGQIQVSARVYCTTQGENTVCQNFTIRNATNHDISVQKINVDYPHNGASMAFNISATLCSGNIIKPGQSCSDFAVQPSVALGPGSYNFRLSVNNGFAASFVESPTLIVNANVNDCEALTGEKWSAGQWVTYNGEGAVVISTTPCKIMTRRLGEPTGSSCALTPTENRCLTWGSSCNTGADPIFKDSAADSAYHRWDGKANTLAIKQKCLDNAIAADAANYCYCLKLNPDGTLNGDPLIADLNDPVACPGKWYLPAAAELFGPVQDLLFNNLVALSPINYNTSTEYSAADRFVWQPDAGTVQGQFAAKSAFYGVRCMQVLGE